MQEVSGAEELSAKWFPQKQKRVAGDLKVRGPTSSPWGVTATPGNVTLARNVVICLGPCCWR